MSTLLPHLLKRTARWLPVLLLPLAARAQAPANDNPAGAIALPIAATCTPTSATNVGATTTAAAGLGYSNPGCGVAINPKDVWFTFTTAAAGQPGSTGVLLTVTGNPAGQVRVFRSAGGAAGPFTSVGCAAGATNNTQAGPLSLTGLTPATTYYVFVSGYSSTGTQGAFTICATILPPNDLSADAVYALTKLPIPQGAPHVVQAKVTNRGASAQPAKVATLTITGANAFTTTQAVPALAVGASATVSFAAFTPTATGTNTLTVTLPADDNNANNSQSAAQTVNTTTYSYADAGPATEGYGSFVSSTVNYSNVLTCRYTTSAPLNVTQVRAYLVDKVTGAGSTVGKTVFGVLQDANGNVLARSADYVVQAADINTYVTFPLAPLVSLPAGTAFFAGLAQTYQPGQTTTYYPLGIQPSVPGRTDATYYSSTTTYYGPTPPDSFGPTFDVKFMLEAVTTTTGVAPCAPPTALTTSALTATGTTLAFTAPGGAGSYTVAYAPLFGALFGTPVTATATGSPVVLSGLNPSTYYAVTVSSSCGGGQVSLPALSFFSTPPTAAPYATLPYTQDFESAWLNVAAVRDAPGTNWRNTLATGDYSWRREDDGASANWTGNGGGSYVPVSSQGAHAARFHSYNAYPGFYGTLDLYVNLSGPGTKRLQFDYLNKEGADSLSVLVSTDGGATFGATPLLKLAVSPTFTTQTVTLASTSATTVVRFRAVGDYGLTDLNNNSDISIDNVRLAVVLASRSQALAAQVGVFPNPAHGNLSVQVPAGPLGAATATLRNALGQAVLMRPLALPAAGGTATLPLGGLAPGLYTLELLAGETLVVKRVVLD